ncbi:hypothetical protein ACLBWP_09505 [Microbacterium sp. M1A1_1b]|uniref:hypothetical protein n=1 Tax=Curtobacterium sp. VKM Ac-2922 TaxID=2929475 RepID=UPI001FB1D2A5|nr:hypothetical protein [Curtobacterium sp. VKM Ac-2922]MCJ1714132.1 hypothetical protein [Curtobacterium sp. VKM Ac-2922]
MRQRTGRQTEVVVAGGVLGFVAGVVVDLALVAWAFSAAFRGDPLVRLGTMLRTIEGHGSVTVVSGAGMVLAPLVVGVIGALAGFLLSGRPRASP